MNKKSIKASVVLIIFIFSLLTVFMPLYAYADTTITEYNTIAHHYFKTLGADIPHNWHGSCAYIALCMLLSFYDFHWNDLFVADNYENPRGESARVNLEYPIGVPILLLENLELSIEEETNEVAYRNFIQNNSLNYLHMYLLSLGIQNNLHNDGDEGFGLTLVETTSLLDKYFDIIFGSADYYRADGNYSENLPVTIHKLEESDPGQSRESILNAIKSQVTKGNPVIYAAAKTISNENDNESDNDSANQNNKVRHAMIAFNVTDSGDIELHKGSTIGGTYENVSSTEYNLNIKALWLEINENILPHVCSYHYDFYRYPSETPACACLVYGDLHPKHTHVNSGTLLRRDDASHTYECLRGCEVTEPHNLTYQSISNAYHTSECECGYTNVAQHNMERTSARFSVCSDCRYTRDHQQGGHEMIPWKEEKDSETE